MVCAAQGHCSGYLVMGGQRLYLIVGQDCWPGAWQQQDCSIGSAAAQSLCSGFLLSRDWSRQLSGAVNSVPRLSGVMKRARCLVTRIRQNCPPSSLARERLPAGLRGCGEDCGQPGSERWLL